MSADDPLIQDDRSGAVFSDDREYRYRLWRTWDIDAPTLALDHARVIERVQQIPAKIDFDLEGVAEIKQKQLQRQEGEAVMENL